MDINKGGTLGLLEEVVNWAVTATTGTPHESKEGHRKREISRDADRDFRKWWDHKNESNKEKDREMERLNHEKERIDRQIFIEKERAELKRR